MKNNVQFHVVEHRSVVATWILYFKLLSECFIKTLLLAFVLESVTFVAISWSLFSEVWSEVKWSEVAQSCPTLCDPMDCSLPGFFCPWIFPGNSTGVGCHFLLQGILHCRQMLYPLSHQGSPLWSLLPPNHRTHIPWGCKVFFWSRVTQYLYWAPKTSWHGIKCLSSSAILPLHYVLIS